MLLCCLRCLFVAQLLDTVYVYVQHLGRTVDFEDLTPPEICSMWLDVHGVGECATSEDLVGDVLISCQHKDI